VPLPALRRRRPRRGGRAARAGALLHDSFSFSFICFLAIFGGCKEIFVADEISEKIVWTHTTASLFWRTKKKIVENKFRGPQALQLFKVSVMNYVFRKWNTVPAFPRTAVSREPESCRSWREKLSPMASRCLHPASGAGPA
jgi:hypothetical protein